MSVKKGDVFNYLTCIEPNVERYSISDHLSLFRCKCGKEVKVSNNNVQRGNTRSCGCYKRETTHNLLTTHGLTDTKVYRAWCSIKRRCTYTKDIQYNSYGGRGIKVCDRWLSSFCNFYSDMGDPPTAQHTIDRIDNNGDYEPSNCRWASYREQARNKQNTRYVEWEGSLYNIHDLAAKYNIDTRNILKRLSRNWTLERALTQPLRKD
jgi:hypothetical protein